MATPYTTQPMMNQPTGGSNPGAPPSYVGGQSQPNMGQPQQPQPAQMQPMQRQMTGGGSEHQRGMSMYGGQPQYPPQQQQMGYQPTNYYEQKDPGPQMQGYQPGMQQQYMQPGFQQPQFVQQQPQFVQPQFTGAPVQQPVTNVININNGAPQTAVVPVVYACANGHTPYTPVPITGILWAVLCFPIGLICLFSEMQTRCSTCGALL